MDKWGSFSGLNRCQLEVDCSGITKAYHNACRATARAKCSGVCCGGHRVVTHDKPDKTSDINQKGGKVVFPSPISISLTIGQGSKLNPIAATFTPRQTKMGFTIARGTSTSEDTTTESQPRLASSQTSHQWSDEVTAEEERTKLQGQFEAPVSSPPSRAEELKQHLDNFTTTASGIGTKVEAVSHIEATGNGKIREYSTCH